MLAMEHHYIVTEAIPELAGLEREIVNTTDFTGEIYLRQEGQGVLLGTYEQDCKVWSPDDTPDDFPRQLLPDEFERIAPEFEARLPPFPRRRAAPASRRSINGPFTFAPDGNPLVGPVKGLPNYWVACAVMAGFSQGGGIGLVLSRWMAEDDPGQDILSMDVGALRPLRHAEVHQHQGAGELPPPLPPALSQRGDAGGPALPPHPGLRPAEGARARCSARISGWRARSGSRRRASSRVETPTYRRSDAFPHVRAECHAVRTGVGLYETTNYGKYEITGSGARAWLDRVFACRIPRPGRMAIAPMLNARGRVDRRSLDRLPRRGSLPHRRLRLRRGVPHALVLAVQHPPDDVFVRSACSTLTGFSLSGPKARDLAGTSRRLRRVERGVQVLRRARGRGRHVARHRAALRLHRRARLRDLGHARLPAPALRRPPGRRARTSASPTTAAGRMSSLRLEKNYGSFNKDFRPDYTPAETGLDAFVDFDKNVDFTGRAAVLAENGSAGRRSASSSWRSMRRRRRRRLRGRAEGRRARRPRHLGRLRPLGRHEPRRRLRAGGAGRDGERLRHRHPRRRSAARSSRRVRCTTPRAQGCGHERSPDNLPRPLTRIAREHRADATAAAPAAALDRPVQRRRCRDSTNRWSPLEILTPEQVERILDGAFRVLEEAGLEIRSAGARAHLRPAGALVDDETQMVRIGRDIVEARWRSAPETLRAARAQRRRATCTSAATS